MSTRYASDLTDAQWALLEPLVCPERPKGGRPPTYSKREILNALFYREKSGCQWRMLPTNLPPWNLVWQHFRGWRDSGLLESIRTTLNQKVRQKASREPTPSVLLADSQSVKTVLKGGSAASTGARRSRGASAT